MATNRPEEQGEPSSIRPRPQNEALRSHEDRADRVTTDSSPEIHSSPQFFKCWQDGIRDSEIEDFVYREPPLIAGIRGA